MTAVNIVPSFDVAIRDPADLIDGIVSAVAKPSAGVRPIDITFSAASDMPYYAREMLIPQKLQSRCSRRPRISRHNSKTNKLIYICKDRLE